MEQVDPCLLQPERPRNEGRTLDLSLLAQPRPGSHVVGAGDVLGIYIEGVLGEATNGPPVVSPSLGASPGALTTATVASAKLGFPVTVRHDGAIALPYKPAIPVQGLTIDQVEGRIRQTYSGPDGLLRSGRDRIFVTLHKPRTVRVLVVRKDRPTEPFYSQPPDYRRADDGRGTAVLVELPAFENDVLHALVASGGLPGPDAENAVYVMRSGGTATACQQPAMPQQMMPRSTVAPVIQQTAGRVVSTMPVPAQWNSTDAGALYAMQSTGRPVPNVPAFAHVSYGQQPLVGQPVQYPQPSSIPASHQPTTHPLANLADPFARQTTAPRPRPSATQITRNDPYAPASNSVLQINYNQNPMPSHSTTPLSHTTACSNGNAGMVSNVDPNATANGACCHGALYNDSSVANPMIRKIPLTILPGETPQFSRADVLLSDGDIVFIESRSQEYFYTAGLLGGGKYPLPGNEDTDLLDAIALADSQRRTLPTRHIGGVSSLNQDVTIGASKVIIFREDQNGFTIPIKVDLNKIKRNPATAPVVLPGDRIVLQYTKLEAIAAGFERHFLEGSVLGIASGITFGNN